MKKLVDIDENVLEEARQVLGVSTYKETVNAGLHEIVAIAARRREVERFTATDTLDVEYPEVVASAWRP